MKSVKKQEIIISFLLVFFLFGCKNKINITAFSIENVSSKEVELLGFRKKKTDVIYYNKQFNDTSISYQYDDDGINVVAKIITIELSQNLKSMEDFFSTELDMRVLSSENFGSYVKNKLVRKNGIVYYCTFHHDISKLSELTFICKYSDNKKLINNEK